MSPPGPGPGPAAPSFTEPPPPPRPGPGAGPAPRRSRTGLVAQFVLQFVYLPLWVLVAVGLVVLAIWLDGAGNANVGPPPGVFSFSKAALSWRRLRIEWRGRAEDWAPFTEELLRGRFAKAEENSGWAPALLPPSGVRRATTQLPLRHYRGLGAGGVEQLARRHGWSVDWTRHRAGTEKVHLFRLLPPPVHTGVPDPCGPPVPPGAPWGPLPARLAMPLLTFVFLPRLRTLELRRDPEAYAAHLRRYLAKRFATELARDRRAHYTADDDGRILRRVAVSSRHYRAAGAQAVLRVAAEQGWRLDHSYRTEPERTVRLCRPDGP
ncbi:hypothetical protein HEK616_61970 [Streptomyces nigrescens]|uniref:Uncharacterized protein n=1 Tax=Streptomyces nigrescens TaxID=1920 RepID=A0ABM8A248_STRNI|nr:hypothetical protein [Streptomyces nigrescens]BDM72710.1 hypothetical protein HEK616_61970 [Streptomyces nigrescens]